MILAQALGGYTLVQIALTLVVLAGIIGIVFVIVRQTGVTIPPFIITVIWICIAVVIGVVAIKFLAGYL